MSADSLSRLLRRAPGAGLFPDLPKEANRPAIFALLFWSCWAATLAVHAFGLFEERRFGLAPVAPALVALALAWAALPWTPRAPWRRKLAAPAFLAGTFVVGHLTNLNLSIVFYAVVVADGVFVFGFRKGVFYAAAILPIFFLNVLLVDGAEVALVATAIAVPFAVFVIGICAAVVEALERREQAQGLLGELESANAQLARHAARVRELSVSEERARMAREMHDSVGHYLTVVNVQLEAAAMRLESRPEEARERVEKAKGLASEALSEVRRSVRALKSPTATDGADAFEALVRNFDGAGPAVSFVVEGEELDLSREALHALYRALQEGLTNASKHSAARRVRATLAYGPRGARLTVADDGGGAPGTPGGTGERGFGLSALKERVESLGGAFSAGNAPDGGFSLVVDLPAGLPEGTRAAPTRAGSAR